MNDGQDRRVVAADYVTLEDGTGLVHTAEPDNGHGRLDERTVWACEQVDWLRRRHPDWIDLRGIVCVEGKRLDFATGQQSTERRYDLTSLAPRRFGAPRLEELVRGPWSVENHLHLCPDFSFADDQSRVRKDHGPENLALIKRLTLGLLKQIDPPARTPAAARRTSIPRRRLAAMLNDPYLLLCLTA